MTAAVSLRISGAFVLVAALVVVASNGGCHDPRFKQAQRIRTARIQQISQTWSARDEDWPARVQHVMDVHQEFSARRAADLKRTLKIIEDQGRVDRRQWRDRAAERQAWCRALRDGKPEEIPRVWAAMVY